MAKITAIIPTLNEEIHIGKAIDSVSFADEIIVIDSFSSDKTVALAKAKNVTVLQRKFDDFSSQKNYAISKAKNEWIFLLDADEQISEELISEIQYKVQNPKDNEGFYIYRKMFFYNKQIRFTGFQRSRVIRLFKKSKSYYRGNVHEVLEVSGKVGRLQNKIKHFSYNGFENYKSKLNLYAKLQAKSLNETNKEVTPYHLFVKPSIRFLLHFIFKFGFLDGKKGFILSYLQAYGVYKRYVELKELNKNDKVSKLVIPKKTDVNPIDFVFLWVDGNDPVHREKMSQFIEKKNSMNSKSIRTRFDQVNEIEYAVNSVLKYAKFVRNIYIVTDNQTPKFLKNKEESKQKYSNVKIIDHKIIFGEHSKYLPVFNSRSIATMLYKIPNLSEHFICSCDDFLLINPTKSTDYFINGQPLLRGEWKAFNEDILHKRIHRFFLKLIGKPKKENFAGHFKAQQLIAKKLGFKKYYKLHHVPMPMRKSTFKNYFDTHPDEFENNIKHRFRDPSQFLLESLINHLEIKNKTCTLTNNYQLVYFQNYKKPFFWIKHKLLSYTKNKDKLFLCMQSLDQCPEEKLNFILDWLDIKYK